MCDRHSIAKPGFSGSDKSTENSAETSANGDGEIRVGGGLPERALRREVGDRGLLGLMGLSAVGDETRERSSSGDG